MPIDSVTSADSCYDPGARLSGLDDVALLKSTPVVFALNFSRLLQGKKRGTAAALAKYMGVTEATISRWKDGLNPPSLDDIDAIAAFFKKPPSWFIIDPSDPESVGITHEVAWRMIGELLPKDPVDS